MELDKLDGKIVGIISDDFKCKNYNGKKVKEIIVERIESSLKMVGLSESVLDKDFDELGGSTRARVVLASKLSDKKIVLVNFSKWLTKKEMDFFKQLFKKITKYDRRIYLVDKNSYMFLDCVNNIYVLEKKKIVYETNDIYDKNLSEYIDLPEIVKFVYESEKHGVKINQYKEIDEMLKAIYRIKS